MAPVGPGWSRRVKDTKISYKNRGGFPAAEFRTPCHPVVVDISPLLDLLVPRRCVLCHGRSTASLCTGCEADLPAISGACPQCGLPLTMPWIDHAGAPDAAVPCGECVRKPPPFERTVVALEYVFPTTVLVQRFKFNRAFACGAALAEQLIRAIEEAEQDSAGRADLIVPVPLHPARLFRRAFNQAEVIAHDVGNALGVRVAPRVLRRRRRTAAQFGLSAAERRRNLRGAICARSLGSRPSGSQPLGAQPSGVRHVALVDDVMTTGATVSECARALKRAGAEKVSVWVAARAT